MISLSTFPTLCLIHQVRCEDFLALHTVAASLMPDIPLASLLLDACPVSTSNRCLCHTRSQNVPCCQTAVRRSWRLRSVHWEAAEPGSVAHVPGSASGADSALTQLIGPLS